MGHGKGVFSMCRIAKGEILEVCPVFRLTWPAGELMDDYAMHFGAEPGLVLPLGLGAVYNHRVNPQVEYFYDPETEMVVYWASQDIEVGEELFIDYGQTYFITRGLLLPLS